MTSWRNRNEAWASVARGIRAAADQIAVSVTPREEPRRLSGRWDGRLRRSSLPHRTADGPDSAPDWELAIDLEHEGDELELWERRAPLAIDGGLIGREDELMDLLGQIDCGQALLWGRDGIGKTVLARRIAEELSPHYGTRLELDLMGAGDEPLSPIAAMTLVLRALGREQSSKDERVLSFAFRAVLASRRPILILDGARDGAQVAPLLTDSGCLVLITSTQHFTLPNLYVRQLDHLHPTDAIALIQALAPHVSDTAAGEIAMLCGYLPLALRLAAGALAPQNELDPFEYIARLKAAPGEIDPSTRVMSTSFDLLDQPTRDLWCRLSVNPGYLSEETLSKAELLASRPAYFILRRYGLIEWDQLSVSYRMHQLARAYARLRQAPMERQIAE